MFTFQDVAIATGGAIRQHRENPSVSQLVIDSRKLAAPAGSLFFAICGERHNGHQFVAELYEKGVRQFVVQQTQTLRLSELPEASILEVADSTQALQQVAAAHRRKFTLPVIGITGSNGKTIVKEWLATLLGKQFRVVKSPRSYNSQVGVPLSVWQINEPHTLGIFEAGISRPNEMANIAAVIQPTIGLFTNIGTAHDEGFVSREQKIREKAMLFATCQTIVYCRDHATVHEALQTIRQADQRLFCWSIQGEKADLSIQVTGKKTSATDVRITFNEETFPLTIPFADEASLENALHGVATAWLLKMEITEIQARLSLLQPVSMRLELKAARNGSYLIDDTYNNDIGGLTIALDFLHLQRQRTSKTIILSDVLETGVAEQTLYQHINQLLASKQVNRLMGIGEVISRNRDQFTLPGQFFSSTADFIRQLPSLSFRNELILVKGARAFGFEQIVHTLQQQTHETVLEINLDALLHNLNAYRSRLRSGTKIMAMVKAFAYGSGSAEIASFLQFHRVDYLAVAYADEGATLRENGVYLPIMVMNPSVGGFDQLVAYQLEPELYSLPILQSFIQFLEATNGQASIHLKVDTGMHRLGFGEPDIPQLIQLLKQTNRIRIASLFSHLAASNEAVHAEFSHRQIRQFGEMADAIERAMGYRPLRHVLNSAGIVRFPEYQLDMVRLGIGLYGVEITEQESLHLETVGTLKTTISQIKYIPVGETVGYGRRGKVTRNSRIATIAIGYADGFDRRLGNGDGKVFINGKLASTIGSVCMDMTMVDVTDVEAQEGDEVIIFGKPLPITELARQTGTIPYEILTGISERVKRVFYAS